MPDDKTPSTPPPPPEKEKLPLEVKPASDMPSQPLKIDKLKVEAGPLLSRQRYAAKAALDSIKPSTESETVEGSEEAKETSVSVTETESASQDGAVTASNNLPEKAEALEKLGSQTGKGKKPWPWWIRIPVMLIVMSAIAGVGYGAYLWLRETRVEGEIDASEFVLGEAVCVVRDFSPDVQVLRDEYFMARAPLMETISEKSESVKRSREDVQTVENRLKVLRKEATDLQTESDQMIKSFESDQQKLWETQGTALEQEYDQKYAELDSRIKARAQKLKIAYQPRSDIRSAEILVNAFRLGLYDPPKGVKTGVERDWVEKELAMWREYEKDWEIRKSKIRDVVDTQQELVQKKIEETHKRIASLTDRIGESQQELEPLVIELNTSEASLKEAKESEVALREKYMKQILDIPSKNILYNIALQADGNFSWRYIDRQTSPQFPPGKYLAWVRATRQGKEYWAIFPFETILYVRTELKIGSALFFPVEGIIE